MKFTTTAILTTLLTSATALPWSFKSTPNGKYSEEITLHLTLDKPTNRLHNSTPTKSEEMKMIMGLTDICLRVCWPEQPQCPSSWDPKNLGTDDEPCWTCCRNPNDDL
ncbi:hypothetical protein QBC36DRAFT_340571 [Triangularia setosa]|uniref:Uncharacterized protein n=1 Tax=Triangularia setosa TaxID=2587417 RepID=A0AAN6VZ09_9PEZI|nr:hypothetical protein QBC36DRAFT_340571 [Podospora setosa]